MNSWKAEKRQGEIPTPMRSSERSDISSSLKIVLWMCREGKEEKEMSSLSGI